MRERGTFLTTAAVLFAVLGISNLLKPLQMGGARTGFVFFGQRLSGTANVILGPLFGIALLAYAIGIWRMRRWALPLGWAYAAYVLVNLFLFTVRNPEATEPEHRVFGLVYIAVALGISWGAALILRRRADELT